MTPTEKRDYIQRYSNSAVQCFVATIIISIALLALAEAQKIDLIIPICSFGALIPMGFLIKILSSCKEGLPPQQFYHPIRNSSDEESSSS